MDCYHNQILTSKTPDALLTDWYVMTDQINRGHTIAGDGTVYLADDTENNRVLIFEKQDGQFYLPSFSTKSALARITSSMMKRKTFLCTQLHDRTIVRLLPSRPDSPSVALEKILSVPELDQIYVRSFTIDGDDLYFVSGNQSILRTRKKDLKILERFPVPAEISGMIQLTHIQDWFYITVSTDLTGNQDYATILRVQDLNDLSSGSWEDIYDNFAGGGTPYYISSFDGHYYLTEHRIPGHSVWQFDVIDNALTDIRALF
ncbi:MAG: hypothetical protein ACLURV_09695 [Gallintestinimicrobium sp.]